MAKNYAALARSVIAALGGVDNISAVTHCMTRLRFVIKDDQLIDSPTLKTIPGVLGVVRSDNQCQVIIGNTVSQTFQEVVSLLPGDMQPAQPVGKPKLTLRRIGAGILDALIGTMSPLIPVTAVKYTYTVIPALVMTWCLSYIERWVDRITPAVTKNFLKPMLIVLIAAPLAILLIGPIGIWIGSAISALVYTIHGYLGWLSVAIMGALWPLLVMTGMHRVFTPTIIQTIAETGKEGMVMPSEIGANLSLGGSSLAVAWKTKNPELRQTALAAAASAIMAGISEPALYGVAIRLKRPLIASLISGFICGAVAGMAGLASHSMAAPGLFTSVQFFDPANPMSIVWVFAVMALAVVLSFILTLLLGFEDIPVEEAAAQARKYQSVQPTVAKEVSLN
ncbi:PTS system, glucose-like IIB component domain protein [Escherichia coli MP021017.9]|uniref:PTS transporter subunit EIIC n=1 Tax=Escherichia coli TaxID=562 RepID=UPI0002CB8A3C|nr:PTS transporter subunit EIIC [Escherichia coli]EFH3246385.1 PTS cellobiose/arbutin/salicin transporter subunit IIBC [Escherichia coli]EMU77064.1 PTS system, glucose-like IIB component domain protein [Escherichia coli MP021017.9]EMU79811.1 PTS system, glucose-like IIB component domain protein [Escherichia coli MP021017.6]EMU91946.1 PTS system, glucose-like IIB component domain protein [Escherichia coli MP021017.4]EMU96700.1 PTS system, glucose-like IIB component domain protein [Escherichia c